MLLDNANGPRALVLRAAGVNCDIETAHALHLAGAQAVALHINRLAENPRLLEDFELLAVPGGFSYGDDIAAGRIFADQLNRTLGDELLRFVDAGKPVIGICNGFQVLAQTRLLPGPVDDPAASPRDAGANEAEDDTTASAAPGRLPRLCTLTENAGGRFICRWVKLRKLAPQCVWTANWGEDEEIELPIAHAEGRLVFRDERARDLLERAGRVALRYAGEPSETASDLPPNPTGSTNDIAGLCDESGLVLGLMPHPERHVDHSQHPAFASRVVADRRSTLATEPAGLRLFKAAVEHVAARV